MSIDWNKLKAYKKTKQKSFEQLCYQIATREFEHLGSFTSVDDSGGGDGVEFYLSLPSGEKWGWQAKYFEGSVRLNEGGRKGQISKSLKRAIEVHPDLKKWYLCIPMDLTPEEKVWVDKDLVKVLPNDHPLEILVWNESAIHGKLNKPLFEGIRSAFFNDLELSREWFRQSFENSFSIVKNKFDDLLYVPNVSFEAAHIHPVLCSEEFRNDMLKAYERLSAYLQDMYKEADKVFYVGHGAKEDFTNIKRLYEGIQKSSAELLAEILKEIKELSPNKLSQFVAEAWDKDLSDLKNNYDQIIAEWESLKKNVADSEGIPDKGEETYSDRIWNIAYYLRSLIERWQGIIDAINKALTNKVCHILGNGGYGKTNLAVGLAQKYINNAWPVIFIPSVKFSGSNPLHEQILSILDIKSSFSFGEFLDCLNELGKIENVRVPIILDGLNEALNNTGHLNERLAIDLPHTEAEIQRRSHVVLLTTCRTSYKKAIWEDAMDNDIRFVITYGFDELQDKKKLVRKYFDYYKIQADLFFLSLDRFTKPLYLKIFCQCTNPDRKNIKQVTLGFDSICEIFDAFVKQCNDNIYKRIQKAGKLPPISRYRTIASDMLEKLSAHLWLHPSRSLGLEDIMSFTEEANGTIDFNNSIAKFLLEEELLFIRDWTSNGETVYLTYDLMTGYLIAKYLINNTTELGSLFEGENAQRFNEDSFHMLHPYYEDILESLCSLLPIMHGVFAHRLFGEKSGIGRLCQKIFSKSVETTITLSPKYIPAEEVEFIKQLAGPKESMIHLLHLSQGVLFTIDHPFNFNFWQSILEGMTMSSRDISWTEYLRELSSDYIEEINSELDHLLRYPSLSTEQVDKVTLVASFLLWTFTSTNNWLKKQSGQSLYHIGVRFPSILFERFVYAAGINDPQILEWTVVVVYNVVIDLVKSKTEEGPHFFREVIQFISEDLLRPGVAYATGNIVIRNYAFDTLKFLNRKLPDLCPSLDIQTLEKTFKKIGITNWEESPDLDQDQYRDGNSLIDYFFNKYKMPHIGQGRGDEYNPTPEYHAVQAKLRWRAYNLGYKLSLFGEVDKVVARQKHYGDIYAETERYADKYINIAYNEYSGYLESHNKLKYYDKTYYARSFKPLYDPVIPKELEDGFLPEHRFVVEDFIDTTGSLKEWCQNIEVPDISKYLFRNEFLGKSGEWILLFGLVHQRKPEFERQFYFQTNPVFIKRNDISKISRAFDPEDKLGKGTQSIPSSDNVHGSEIPDGEAVPYNEFISWNYKFGEKTIERKYLKIDLYRDGVKLEEKEADFLWNVILKKAGYQYYPRETLAAIKLPAIRIIYSGQEATDNTCTIEEAVSKLGLKLVENYISKTEVCSTFKTIKVMHPIRFLKQKAFLCKNIIDHLNLSTKPGGTDLFDQNGQLASFQYSYQKEFAEQENFTYIRRDLLEKYLSDSKLAMVMINWGERDYYPSDGDWMSKTGGQHKFRSTDYFYQAFEYIGEPPKTKPA